MSERERERECVWRDGLDWMMAAACGCEVVDMVFFFRKPRVLIFI